MYFIMIITVIFLIIRKLLQPQKPPIFGVYRQESIWSPLKFCFMYAVLKIRQLSTPKAIDDPNDPLYASEEDCSTDGVQPHTNHPLAIDAVYFNATSSKGAAMICGVARRPNRICDSFLYFRVDNGDLLLSPALPNTKLNQKPEEENKFHAGGLKIDVIVPMKEWRIQYNGPMKYYNNPKNNVTVQFDLRYKANYKRFNFDKDMCITTIAKFMSREKWSREYFDRLKSTHQTHFEQYGKITGKAVIDGKTFDIKLESMRDHTYGEYRDWRELHRYGLHMINLENGDQMTVGKICFPSLFSNITCGFICKNSTKKIYPVETCDLELYQHGENKTPPLDYAFQFQAGGKLYTVQVNVTDSPVFYIGKDLGAMVVERLATYTVNGIKGWGAAEWQYRNHDSEITKGLER